MATFLKAWLVLGAKADAAVEEAAKRAQESILVIFIICCSGMIGFGLFVKKATAPTDMIHGDDDVVLIPQILGYTSIGLL